MSLPPCRNLRRTLACVVALCLLLGCKESPPPTPTPAAAPATHTIAPPADRPNIVVILIDTLRADHLGSYGFDGPISPNLDRLAAESVQFDRCFTQAPWTKPAVATLFTGLDPGTHQVLTHRGHLGNPKDYRPGAALQTDVLHSQLRTLAEELRDSGYATGAVVVNPWLERSQGFAQGFDDYEDRLRGNGVKANAVLQRANSWLARRPADRPFFLYLHFMDVHPPFEAAEADVEAVRDSPSLGPPRTLDRSQLAPGMLEYPKSPAAAWARTPAFFELREWRTRYAAGVHALDRELGGFFDRLRADGTLDRSLVVVVADHGEELFDHLDWGHGKNLYDHQLHVPLLIRRPGGVGGGRRVDALVALADLMPTLVATGTGRVPTGVWGRDLGPLLRGESLAVVHEEVFATSVKWKPGEHSLRTLRDKLIVDLDADQARLYEVDADAAESRDVAAAQLERVAELRRHLAAHLASLHSAESRAGESAEIPAETAERLRALGYLDEENEP